MKRASLCATIVACVSAAGLAIAKAEPFDQGDLSSFRSYLSEFRTENALPSLSVVVLKDGEIVLQEFLGTSDDERDFPTTERTSYFIASVTKSLAGVVLTRAEEDGLVDFDALIADAYPDWAPFCDWYQSSGIIFAGGETDSGETIAQLDCDQPITVRHLLTHTLNGAPGESFAYNPIAFARLSRLFPEDGPGSFYDLLYRYVFDPADMTQSAAGWRDRERGYVLSDLAQPFRLSEDGARFEKTPLPDDDLRTAAGVYASALDLAKFDQALDTGTLLSPAAKEAMWTPPLDADGEPLPYAHGWYVQTHRGERLVWHSGWQPEAYSALYLKVPERNVTLIALGNSEGLWWDNGITQAQVENSPLAAQFLDTFVFGDD